MCLTDFSLSSLSDKKSPWTDTWDSVLKRLNLSDSIRLTSTGHINVKRIFSTCPPDTGRIVLVGKGVLKKRPFNIWVSDLQSEYPLVPYPRFVSCSPCLYRFEALPFLIVHILSGESWDTSRRKKSWKAVCCAFWAMCPARQLPEAPHPSPIRATQSPAYAVAAQIVKDYQDGFWPLWLAILANGSWKLPMSLSVYLKICPERCCRLSLYLFGWGVRATPSVSSQGLAITVQRLRHSLFSGDQPFSRMNLFLILLILSMR